MVEEQRVEGVTPSGSGSQASPEAATASSPSVSIPNAITLAREIAIRDETIDEVARWIEEASFREIMGICAKRKRVREDAELRGQTIREERRDLADMIRARKANRYDRPDEMLRDIAAGSFGHRRGLSTHDLKDALLLARRGLVTISVEAVIAGSYNSSTPETIWRVKLNERGEAALAELDGAEEVK